MAVILQPMTPIQAEDRSGVVFSHSPVPTMPGILIQAAYGTGQTVVQGYGGDLFVVQNGRVTVQPMPASKIQISGPQGYLIQAPGPQQTALTEVEALELASMVQSVAERWNGPVDVEFIWRKGERPTLVQVRSATGLHR
jgi:phosphoenolpyruvate synthase/pyruvate phosphate dikinase